MKNSAANLVTGAEKKGGQAFWLWGGSNEPVNREYDTTAQEILRKASRCLLEWPAGSWGQSLMG